MRGESCAQGNVLILVSSDENLHSAFLTLSYTQGLLEPLQVIGNALENGLF